jgi:hypothetical protein
MIENTVLPAASARLHWKANLLLMAASLIVALGLAEIALRLLDYSYYHAFGMRPDVEHGWAPRPDARGWQTLEGRVYITINAAGFRDGTHDLAKPRGTLRIAVLGDSFSEALQVPLGGTFWRVLERELGACEALSGRKVEVLNFGVSGYSTAQEFITLQQRVWDYDPDIVLLAFFTGNDLTENLRDLDKDPLAPKRPYFIYEGEQLVLDASFRDAPAFRWERSWYGRVLQELTARLRVAQLLEQAAANIALSGAVPPQQAVSPQEPGIDTGVYQVPQDAAWRKAWRVTEGLLVAMHDEVEAHGADLLVVTLTNGLQVHPNPFFRESFKLALGTPTLLYPDQRIRELGEREGFAVLNLAPELQAYAELNRVFLHGFENSILGAGHWNSEGHRLAGETIARAMCAGSLLRWDTAPSAEAAPAASEQCHLHGGRSRPDGDRGLGDDARPAVVEPSVTGSGRVDGDNVDTQLRATAGKEALDETRAAQGVPVGDPESVLVHELLRLDAHGNGGVTHPFAALHGIQARPAALGEHARFALPASPGHQPGATALQQDGQASIRPGKVADCSATVMVKSDSPAHFGISS